MDTKYLSTFRAILETGSFQKAADRLNYTQSTVTAHVQHLEAELSIKLFEKIGRKMILTDAGKKILPYVDVVLHTLTQIRNEGCGISEMGGTLCVALPESLIVYRMYPVFAAFRERAPGVQLVVKSMNCYEIRDGMLNGAADIGIHYDVGSYADTLLIEKLARFKACLVASSSADADQLDFVTRDQRKALNLISSDPHSIFQKRMTRYLNEKGIVMNRDLEMWSIEAAKKCVAGNLGVAYLPRFAIEAELENGSIVPVQTDLDEIPVGVVCSYHKNKWLSAAMKLFIALTRYHFQKDDIP